MGFMEVSASKRTKEGGGGGGQKRSLFRNPVFKNLRVQRDLQLRTNNKTKKNTREAMGMRSERLLS